MKNKKVEQLQRIIRKEEPANNSSWVNKLPVAVQNTNVKSGDIEHPAQLKVVHVNKLLFEGGLNHYYVMGALPQDESCLKVTLVIADPASDKKERYKVDLYDRVELDQCISSIINAFHQDEEILRAEILMLIDLVEKKRDADIELQPGSTKGRDNVQILVPADEKAAIEMLSSPNLMKRTYKLLDKAWETGHYDLQKMLFMAMASYKSYSPIHVAIIGGKLNVKNFIDNLSKCLPAEDILYLNDISGRSFYHCTNNELVNKAMLLPHGLDKKAMHALSQLQQGNVLSTATTIKDRLGNMVSSMQQVKSHFTSVMYQESFDHGNTNTLMVNLEDTKESISTVQYENAVFSGSVDIVAEEKSRASLQNMVRCLKPMEVINPMAGKLKLPVPGHDLLKITNLYNSFVKQLCLYHQFQRIRDEKGRLLVEKEDLWQAWQMLVYTMASENEDLYPELKEVYNGISKYVSFTAGDNISQFEFKQREIREALGISKNYCFRYMDELLKLEYLTRTGSANRGYKYKLTYSKESAMDKKRKEMADNLLEQIQALGDLHKKAS